MKFLIIGLGNIGAEYVNTRHNIGFKILDTVFSVSNIVFNSDRLASVAEVRHKGRTFILIKPSTYMNLSGKAVNYWLQREKIELENLLVVHDDIALPLGKIRIRPDGNDAGHNGIKNIIETLGHDKFCRLRFGVGNDFPKGGQVDFVLGEWNPDEIKILPERIKIAGDAIKSFGTNGLTFMMNEYNNK